MNPEIKVKDSRKSYPKIKANKLAPDMIGGIVQSIEEDPVKDVNWIESIEISKFNRWKVIIKQHANYYPKSIIKYNQMTKSRILKGTLYEIEEILSKAYTYNEYKKVL